MTKGRQAGKVFMYCIQLCTPDTLLELFGACHAMSCHVMPCHAWKINLPLHPQIMYLVKVEYVLHIWCYSFLDLITNGCRSMKQCKWHIDHFSTQPTSHWYNVMLLLLHLAHLCDHRACTYTFHNKIHLMTQDSWTGKLEPLLWMCGAVDQNY